MKEYREKNPEKYAAHQAVKYALRRGDMERGDCEVCNSPDAHAHHDDYSEPLEVRWLCHAHHMALHAEWRV